MNIPQLVERKFLFASDQPITAPLYEIVIARNGVFKRALRLEMNAAVELSAFAVEIPSELLLTQTLKRFATYFDLDSGASRSVYNTPEAITTAANYEPKRKAKAAGNKSGE